MRPTGDFIAQRGPQHDLGVAKISVGVIPAQTVPVWVGVFCARSSMNASRISTTTRRSSGGRSSGRCLTSPGAVISCAALGPSCGYRS